MNDQFESTLKGDFEGELPDSVDEAAIERIRAVAYLLDESIRIPGTSYRVGLDPLIGTVPVAGDLVSGGLSLYIVLESAYLGVSYSTIVRMLGNVALDVGGGMVPYVGTVFDAVWKTNKRNVELVLDELTERAEQERGGRESAESAESAESDSEDGPITIEVE